jgi:hypothetical protein
MDASFKRADDAWIKQEKEFAYKPADSDEEESDQE